LKGEFEGHTICFVKTNYMDKISWAKDIMNGKKLMGENLSRCTTHDEKDPNLVVIPFSIHFDPHQN
jgi:hypothetical protein